MESRPGRSRAAIGIITAALLTVAIPAWPHGFAGKRIFPTTFEVDDPFVMDEFSLLVSHLKESGTAEVPSQVGTGVSADYTARITEHWGVVVGGEFRRVEPDGGDAMHGFGNLLVGTKYQFFTSDEHEMIASIGVDAAVGNTGDQRIGSDPVSVIYPTVFFGKGMGDLPRSAGFWRPFAVTGTFGAGFPTSRKPLLTLNPQGSVIDAGVTANPTKLIWGLTVQYKPAVSAELRSGRRFDGAVQPDDPGGRTRNGKQPERLLQRPDQRDRQSRPDLVRRLLSVRSGGADTGQ